MYKYEKKKQLSLQIKNDRDVNKLNKLRTEDSPMRLSMNNLPRVTNQAFKTKYSKNFNFQGIHQQW